MSQEHEHIKDLSDILNKYANKLNVKPQWIATRMNKAAGKGGLIATRSLVRNWLDGSSGRIEQWEHLVTIAFVLQINGEDIEKIISISGLQALDKLYMIAEEPLKSIIGSFLSAKKELDSSNEKNNQKVVNVKIPEPIKELPPDENLPEPTSALSNSWINNSRLHINIKNLLFLILGVLLIGTVMVVLWNIFSTEESTTQTCTPERWQSYCYTKEVKVDKPYITHFLPNRYGTHALEISVPVGSYADVTACWKFGAIPSSKYNCWIVSSPLFPQVRRYSIPLITGETDITYEFRFNNIKGAVYYRYLISYTN